MKIEIITSFNQDYYDLIGKNCVETWLKYWPTNLTLTCYVEEFRLPDHPRLNQISFDDFKPEYYEFQSTAEKQVHKFAKKAWSFIHAMENSTADRIVWLDADVLITANPNALNSKPENKVSVKINTPYNKDIIADYEIDSILEFINDSELRNKILTIITTITYEEIN